ncbi:MAG: glycerate kinase [Flavobacteriales bacterium]|nr:glycerate kinase [Flavobacteriales bacterium]
MKKIVVASDSFKGSLTSSQVADSVERGIHTVYPQCQVVKVDVADGGEGTVDAVVGALGGEKVVAVVQDPLGRDIEAMYGIAGNMAVMEMAAASGLPLLDVSERNPWKTSTYGTGQMIKDAMDRGCRRFMVGIGGSATNDAGMGMARALGFKFYDINGVEISEGVGGSLKDVAVIDDGEIDERLAECTFTVACDVDTPFCGKKGAAYVFAPQKGADEDMVKRLDAGMYNYAAVIKEKYGIDIVPMSGAGAAGGLGGGFKALLGASLKKGVDMVLDAICFDELLCGADLLITGEGKVDFQTPRGKTASGVLARGKKAGIKVVVLGGKVEMCDELLGMGFDGIYPITEEVLPLEVAMRYDVASGHVTRTIVEKLLAGR